MSKIAVVPLLAESVDGDVAAEFWVGLRSGSSGLAYVLTDVD